MEQTVTPESQTINVNAHPHGEYMPGGRGYGHGAMPYMGGYCAPGYGAYPCYPGRGALGMSIAALAASVPALIVGGAAWIRENWRRDLPHGGHGGHGAYPAYGAAPVLPPVAPPVYGLGCCEDKLVTKEVFKLGQELACKESVIAELRSEKYTDNKFERLAGAFEMKLDALNDKYDRITDRLSNQVCHLQGDLGMECERRQCGDSLEAERRQCGDKWLHEWTEGHFIRGEKRLNPNQICRDGKIEWCEDRCDRDRYERFGGDGYGYGRGFDGRGFDGRYGQHDHCHEGLEGVLRRSTVEADISIKPKTCCQQTTTP